MRFLLLLALLPALALADHRWVELRYGPFTVATTAGDKAAKEALNHLEQYRNAIGLAIGVKDPQPAWPVTVVLLEKPLGTPARFRLSRDSFIAEGLSPEAFNDLGRLLLDSNSGAMPAFIENALITLYSTLQVSGTHVTLGEPPAPAERTPDWARLQLLATDPRYGGRMRVFLYNLQQTWDFDPAYRNAFERTKDQIDKETEAYIKAGKFATADVSGRAVSPDRDFHARNLESAASGRMLAGDLLLASNPQRAKAEYQASTAPEARDGVALATLDPADLKAAVDAGSRNARVWFEYALGRKDRPSLDKSGKLNPKWDQPHAGLAALEPAPSRQAQEWKIAAHLAPRKARYWQSYAEAATEASLFSDAAKAWLNAERVAADEQERERIRQARLAVDDRRLAAEEAERRRLAGEKQRELDKLKDEALRNIRAAEMRANQDAKPLEVPVVPWSEIHGNPKVAGTLERVDCLGGSKAKLVVRTSDRKLVALLVADPNKTAVAGKGLRSFACGPQRPPRRVSVEYLDKPDPQNGTLGEAATIEFQ